MGVVGVGCQRPVGDAFGFFSEAAELGASVTVFASDPM